LVAVQTVVDKHVDIYYVILWQYFEHYCWVSGYSNKKPHCFLLSLMCGVTKTLYVFQFLEQFAQLNSAHGAGKVGDCYLLKWLHNFLLRSKFSNA